MYDPDKAINELYEENETLKRVKEAAENLLHAYDNVLQYVPEGMEILRGLLTAEEQGEQRWNDIDDDDSSLKHITLHTKTIHIPKWAFDQLEAENAELKRLEQACIQLYVGKITMWAWREAVRSSPEGQRLIALANMYGE